eukprot:365112-Chlamydomonas_euryale.AAC.2
MCWPVTRANVRIREGQSQGSRGLKSKVKGAKLRVKRVKVESQGGQSQDPRGLKSRVKRVTVKSQEGYSQEARGLEVSSVEQLQSPLTRPDNPVSPHDGCGSGRRRCRGCKTAPGQAARWIPAFFLQVRPSPHPLAGRTVRQVVVDLVVDRVEIVRQRQVKQRGERPAEAQVVHRVVRLGLDDGVLGDRRLHMCVDAWACQ